MDLSLKRYRKDLLWFYFHHFVHSIYIYTYILYTLYIYYSRQKKNSPANRGLKLKNNFCGALISVIEFIALKFEIGNYFH